MTGAVLTDRSGMHRHAGARLDEPPVARLLVALVLASTALTGCASGRALAGPSPFPGSRPKSPRPAHVVNLPAESRAGAADAVVRSALSLRGTPYRFGGSTPESGFDCSGLVAHVLARQSITVPRSVAEQFGTGTPVTWDQLQPGDLVFFSTLGPGATHVGIVTDATRAEFVHAPADGASVRTDRFDMPYWRSRFVGARRLI